MLYDLYLISVLLLALGLSYYAANYTLLWETGQDEEQRKLTTLVIGILSARENSAHRQAIRDTWLRETKEFSEFDTKTITNNFKAWFIVGNKYCKIPPEYRLSEYDCKEWNVNLSNIVEKFYTSEEVVGQNFPTNNLKVFSQGFSFQVNHPVLLTKLGVYSKLLPPQGNISVAILDLQTKDILVRVSITSQTSCTLQSGYIYREVENFLLPKGYQGLVLVEGYLFPSASGKMQWNNGSGIISIERVFFTPHSSERFTFAEELQVAASIEFIVQNISTLKKEFSRKEMVTSAWYEKIGNVLQNLKTENENFGDILYVDVLDTYKSLPQKLLHFYKWLTANHNFKFMLKTDDDCIVDVPNVLQLLKTSQFDPNKMWLWSRFRYQWPVNYIGKWADNEYKSPVYPTFPCGGGYVLSQMTVHWLSKNSPYLYPYQGEDVSLGIWLAAVNPFFIEDKNWECDDKCTTDSYNRAQLTADEMFHVWSLYEKCGSLCNCDKKFTK